MAVQQSRWTDQNLTRFSTDQSEKTDQMGTRIYPTTRNSSILEILAGVPAGTFESLQTLLTKQKNEIAEARSQGKSYFECDELGYEHYKARQNRPEGLLDGFLTFGWGKFTNLTYQIIKGNIPSDQDEDWIWCGGTKDLGLIDSIMEAQGVDLEKLGINPEDLEGLSWG